MIVQRPATAAQEAAFSEENFGKEKGETVVPLPKIKLIRVLFLLVEFHMVSGVDVFEGED